MTLKKSAPHEYHTKQRWISGESREVSEPDNLSDRDKEYYDNYCKNFTMSDVETLCKILVHPNEEIFTESNIQEFNYGKVNVGGGNYFVSSYKIKDILLMIHEGEYNKEEVLHDTCQLLGIGKKKNNEELHERCYKHLIEVGYVKLIDK